jgi:hypothetical protein
LQDLLDAGFDILVHSKGGLGRAGTIAARLLVEAGMRADDAIGLVRLRRPGAIETEEQARYSTSAFNRRIRRSAGVSRATCSGRSSRIARFGGSAAGSDRQAQLRRPEMGFHERPIDTNASTMEGGLS